MTRNHNPDGAEPESAAGRRVLWSWVALTALILVAVAWLMLLRQDGGIATRGAADPAANIILITIDTLRADALGFAGNRDVETPFLDALAQRSAVFTDAHAHNVVTLPSHANILTGLYPFQHGVRENSGFTLDEKHRTVAAMLKESGYATGAFVGAYPLDARFGLNRGFDVYDDRYREGSTPLDFKVAERPAEEVLAPAAEWYRANAASKKFLWIHLYDPHAPYRPPAPFAARYADNPYLGEVAAIDAALQKHLGPLLDADPGALLIFTSDHGEALGDHGEATHGLFAYEATLKVPLFLMSPGLAPSRDDRAVRHIDIVPTILEAAGVALPPELPGSSLLDPSGDRDSYFESLSAMLNRGWAPLVGLIHDRKKYIDLPLPELYDLGADPAEANNLFPEDRRAISEIRKRLAELAPAGGAIERTVGEEESARLLSLGYLAGTATPKKAYGPEDDPKNLIDLDNTLHRAVEAYQNGRIAEGIDLARRVVAARPDMTIGREMLAFLLQQSERPEAAIETLEELVALGNASAEVKIRLGLMLSENGRPHEAIDLLEPLSNRDEPELLNAYGIALADVGRREEARRQFRRSLAVDSTNAAAYQNLGIVALRSGNAEEARQFLAKALELNDRLPLALNAMGVVHARSGNAAQAIEAWQRAVAADPRQYDALFNLAMTAGRTGRMDIAIPALRRLVETAPPERYGAEIAQARQILARAQASQRNP